MYTQLQTQTSNTLLNSPMSVSHYVETATRRGYQALGIADVNVVYGLVDFYRQATAAKIKPLLGMTLSLEGLRALVYAETQQGYQQLLVLASALGRSEQVPELAELPAFTGLAVLLISANRSTEDLRTALDKLAAKEPTTLGTAATAAQLSDDAEANRLQGLGVPLFAQEGAAYADGDDAFSQQVLQAIGAGEQINLRNPKIFDAGPDWLRPAVDVNGAFEASPAGQGALANLEALVGRVQAEVPFKQTQLPHYPTPAGESATEYLRALATAGLAQRFANATPDHYLARLDHELGVIDEMGFSDYFLIVWDLINHARESGVRLGAGRGSAAGSLVAYALRISEVDPIRYNLLFERFLNPARANMPDIDIDVPDNRREEILQYLHDRWGDSHVAQIITFGTFGAKQAIRDVARVFGLNQFESNRWAKAIPSSLNMTLERALAESRPLANLIKDSPINAQVFAAAQRIEGLPRHYSTHAAGVVLSAEPLTASVAIQAGGEGIAQTQWPMGDVEAVGLLKIDVLGLRNLTILDFALRAVERQTGKVLDPTTIPLDDPQTLATFASADTGGIFQFDGAGIRSKLQSVEPTSFEDVVAVNALYRPGPMEQIPHFVARKHGQEAITYPVPELEPILKPTYGILVYQEQVMQAASVMGGFTLGEADLLRRAMSKKKKSVIDDERRRFIAGAKAKGYSEESARTVYDYIEEFADYGFNRSHAVAYSMIAYWLTYIKTHYPQAFYSALINTNLNNDEKLRGFILEMRRRRIPIYGPDVNKSGRGFRIEGQGLRFGLSAIKGLRRDFINDLIAARPENGFPDLKGLLIALPSKWLKLDLLMPLVEAGAFDTFDSNRAETAANLAETVETVKLSGASTDLFEVLAPKPQTIADWDEDERLAKEAAVLGVYLHTHPTERLAQALSPLMSVAASDQLEANTKVVLALQVKRIKTIRTKKGDPMAFLDGQDYAGDVSVTVFTNQFAQLEGVEAGDLLIVHGRVESRRDQLQVVAQQIQTPAQVLPPAQVFVRFATRADFEAQTTLLDTLRAHHGRLPVIFLAADTREKIMLDPAYWLGEKEADLLALQAIVGNENVAVKPLSGFGKNS